MTKIAPTFNIRTLTEPGQVRDHKEAAEFLRKRSDTFPERAAEGTSEKMMARMAMIGEAKPRLVLFGETGATIVATAKQAAEGVGKSVKDVFAGMAMLVPIEKTQIADKLGAENSLAVEGVHVVPEFRGQGLMTQMMQAANEHIDLHGVDLAMLAVDADKEGGTRPYQPEPSMTQETRIEMWKRQEFVPFAFRGDGTLVMVRSHSPEVAKAIKEALAGGLTADYQFEVDAKENEKRGHDTASEVVAQFGPVSAEIRQERAALASS